MDYIKRTIEDTLQKSLSNRKAIFILGPRQVGKTTLLNRLMEICSKENSLYYDLGLQSDLEVFSDSLENILARFRFDKKSKAGKTFVFIDEVQNVSDFSHKIKALVDHHSNEFKLVLTGSSSVLIRRQFSESLAGRKEEHILYPLNFSEFCLFKGEEKTAGLLDQGYSHEEHYPLHLYPGKMKNLLAEYMVYGGYPEVVLLNNADAKADLLDELVSSTVIKDIRHLFRIEKIEQFNKLVKYLAINTGKEINLQSIFRTIELHYETVLSYLMVLEASFIISKITPFYTNKTKEMVKMPKVYMIDMGIRNKLVNNLNPPESREDKGELFENLVFLNLLHKKDALTEIKYWKTKFQQEVDFVVNRNQAITAYEAKFGKDRNNHFTAFSRAYPKAQCRIVRYDYRYKEDELPAYF